MITFFGNSFKKIILAILNNSLEDLAYWKPKYLRVGALKFANSEDCEFMCDVIGVNYDIFKKVANMRYENEERKDKRIN